MFPSPLWHSNRGVNIWLAPFLIKVRAPCDRSIFQGWTKNSGDMYYEQYGSLSGEKEKKKGELNYLTIFWRFFFSDRETCRRWRWSYSFLINTNHIYRQPSSVFPNHTCISRVTVQLIRCSSGKCSGTIAVSAFYLPDCISAGAAARLFADDCVMYRTIKTEEDASLLQQDLSHLQQWETDWQIAFSLPLLEVGDWLADGIPPTEVPSYPILICWFDLISLLFRFTGKYSGSSLGKNWAQGTSFRQVCKHYY